MSIGHLSAPTLPNIENIQKFSGEWFHTGLWPKEEVTFSGKDVVVVGTGHLGSIHAAIYARMPAVELIGIIDIDASTANKVASECHCDHKGL